jgi:catechol-2,3-dioxygenase
MEISLPIPLPLHWLRMLVDMAHDTIPVEGVSDQLGAAAAYLDELDNNPNRDPFAMRVDDGDGNGVEVYIG